MTRQLFVALYAEGSTDESFLPIVIEKTIREIPEINTPLEVLVDSVNLPADTKKRLNRAQKIRRIAQEVKHSDILVIHSDSDKRSWEQTRAELFEPGLELVQQEPDRTVCKDLLPLIPIRMIEAWLLADTQALIETIGTTKTAMELNLPATPQEIESRADPKEILREAVRLAIQDQPKRRRQRALVSSEISSLYLSVGQKVRLEQLRKLSAYQKFVEDLTGALQAIGLMLGNE